MALTGRKVPVRAGNLIQVLKNFQQIFAETKGHSFICSIQPESSDMEFPWGDQRLDFGHCWASHSLMYFLSISCQVEYDTLHAAKTHFLLACLQHKFEKNKAKHWQNPGTSSARCASAPHVAGILSHSPEGIQLGLKSAGSLLAVPKQLCSRCAHTGRAVQPSAGRLQKAEGSLCVPWTAQHHTKGTAPVKQHQTTHREGSTLGEPWLRSMCQDCISTRTQVSCAPDAFWPFQCLWWTGLSQDGHEGCLWPPAAVVQKDLLVYIPSSHAHYMSLWERSPETGNPAKSLLCLLQDCPQVQWPAGSRSRDSAIHPHSLKATESPAPISVDLRRKPSILCFFIDSNYSHGVGNRVTILIRKKTFLLPVIYTHCSHIKSVTWMTDPWN